MEENELREARELEAIDGRPIESGTIITMVQMSLGIKEHQKELPAFVIKLGYYSIVLGLLWLELPKATDKFQCKRIDFESS